MKIVFIILSVVFGLAAVSTIRSITIDKNETEPITLLFGGDCTFAVHYDINTKDNYQRTFEQIPWIADADITMINLESCISNRGTKVEKEFNFRMKPKYLPVLKLAGIDIVNLANNHTIDYGKIAFEDTFHYLDSMGIKYTGAGMNLAEARKPVIVDVKSKKIGFLGYSFAFRAYDNSFGTVPIDTNIIKEDIANLRQNEKVDFVIINFHWGVEGKNYPKLSQQIIARSVIDNGADLIIGHHPHVMQGIEKYKDKYIVYSLGNFIFGGNSRKKHYTFLYKVEINQGGIVPQIIPIVVKNFAAEELPIQTQDSILNLINEYSKDLTNNR